MNESNEERLLKELGATRTLLFNLIHNSSPAWHYQTGKTGYECFCCQSMTKILDDFIKPSSHRQDCEYIIARQLVHGGNPLKNKVTPAADIISSQKESK